MKLYHYVHCPFCVRVRLGAGLLNLSYQSIVLPYHDEETPKKLTGVKMLPIWEDQAGARNESLDILRSLDKENKLKWELLKDNKIHDELEVLLDDLGGPIHNLCMPYWVWTPEFNEESRKYFIEKKSLKRGPFHLLMKNADHDLKELKPKLEALAHQLSPFYAHQASLTILDLMVASHLWGLMILPEFRFDQKLYDYLMTIKSHCRFDYHEDFKNEDIFKIK